MVLSCYPMRPGRQILKNFNLIIPVSKTVAIVGESGGKSTVASLLELSFDPSSGVIMLDGLDIRTLDPSQRTSHLIHNSGHCAVMENICFGKRGLLMLRSLMLPSRPTTTASSQAFQMDTTLWWVSSLPRLELLSKGGLLTSSAGRDQRDRCEQYFAELPTLT
ncbi:mitochondrial potassium channel ATP-binding subunit-like [Oncorhynchus masou masou]|uniref:mitochondrial potassium channel ATP-binding subunit-like n=1 Tax=Oncorhynchus masou masou TaxID=90313 RepID=UPI003183EB5B